MKIRIDVSGEQIRFELLEKTSRLTWQNMPLTTQRLVDCTLFNKESHKKRGRSILVFCFRGKIDVCVFLSDRTKIFLRFESQQESDGSRNYQTYDLESTVEIAEQFRNQIFNIIKLKNPQGREIYEQQQRHDTAKKRRSLFNIIGGSGTSGSSSKS